MPTDHHSMSGAEFRAVCARMFADPDRPGDEGQSAAARFLGNDPRTIRVWVEKGPPAAVALFLKYLEAARLKPADVLKAVLRKR